MNRIPLYNSRMLSWRPKCRSCAGSHCFKCDGTGYSEDACELREEQFRYEWERYFRAYQGGSWAGSVYYRDNRSQTLRTRAMDAAVEALELAIAKKREKEQAKCNSKMESEIVSEELILST